MERTETTNETLIGYFTFHFKLPAQLGISILQYALAELVQANESNTPNRWCIVPKKELMDKLGASKGTFFHNINELVDKGYLERLEVVSYLRVTQKYLKAKSLIKHG